MLNKAPSLKLFLAMLPLLFFGATLSMALPASAGSQRGVRPDDQSNNGPVRMAYFTYVSGNVSWRRSANAQWSDASTNLPIRQGAQIWVAANGRGEIQFDDGSRLRLGGGALATLQTMYSDSEGEFTEITLNNGPATLRLKHEHSVYQINTPVTSINATGPARIRLGVDNGTRLAVLQGHATIEGRQGKAQFQTGDYLDLANDSSPYDIRPMPRSDSYSDWSDARDRNLDRYALNSANRSLPSNISLVADNFDEYGTWRSDPQYGQIWYPRHSQSNWRPYSNGQWVWVDPYGWTWVDREPWGWAPSHYGTWVHRSYGWGWVHGPSNQYWSPGIVAFNDYGGSQAWVALSPAEVSYPTSLGIGFRSGNWSLFFSIGQAGVYYPSRSNIYSGSPWQSNYVNRVTYVNNTTVINNRNTYITNTNYVPANARFGGATITDSRTFGGRGSFRSIPQGSVNNVFARGRSVMAPPNGQVTVSGPAAFRPTAISMTPSRTFSSNVRVPASALSRAVYRAPLRPVVAAVSTPVLLAKPVNRIPRMIARNVNAAGQTRTAGPLTQRPGAQTPTTRPNTVNRTVNPTNASPAERARLARQTIGTGSQVKNATAPTVNGPGNQANRKPNTQQSTRASVQNTRKPTSQQQKRNNNTNAQRPTVQQPSSVKKSPTENRKTQQPTRVRKPPVDRPKSQEPSRRENPPENRQSRTPTTRNDRPREQTPPKHEEHPNKRPPKERAPRTEPAQQDKHHEAQQNKQKESRPKHKPDGKDTGPG